MNIIATRKHPVTVYYCKANVKTGLTVRVMSRVSGSVDCRGVTLASRDGEAFTATMVHGNSTGPAKASGARCVLQVTSGIVTTLS